MMSPSPPPPAPEHSAGAVHRECEPVRGLPANVTFDTLIARNRRNSAFLVVLMLGLITLFGAAIGIVFSVVGAQDQFQTQSMIFATIVGGVIGFGVAILASVWSWYGGASAILRMTGAQEINKAHDPQLFNIVEELAIAGGVPMPKVYVITDDAMNAFATGRDPEHGIVAITSGLRAQLTRDELAGVMAHEISHIRHYDIRLGMLMATLAAIIVFAADAGMRGAFYGSMFGGSGRSRSSSGGGGGNPMAIIILVIAIIFIVFAPLCAMAVRFAMSREREFLADAGAVELTRYPDGLASALKKLGGHRQPLRHVGKSTAPLFIVNPLKAAVRHNRHDKSNVFSTHPPLSERIARLKALG